MDQIRGEAVRLMSSEGSAALYIPIRPGRDVEFYATGDAAHGGGFLFWAMH